MTEDKPFSAEHLLTYITDFCVPDDLLGLVSNASRKALTEAFIDAGADEKSVHPEIDRLIQTIAASVSDIVNFGEDTARFKSMVKAAKAARGDASQLSNNLQKLGNLELFLINAGIRRSSGDETSLAAVTRDIRSLEMALSDVVSQYANSGGRPLNAAARRVLAAGCKMWRDQTGHLPSYSKSSGTLPKLLECIRSVALEMRDISFVKDELSLDAFIRARAQIASEVKEQN